MKIKVIQSVYCVEPESYKNLAKIDFYLMGRIINKGDIYELKKDNFVKTSRRDGLTALHTRKAITILNTTLNND